MKKRVLTPQKVMEAYIDLASTLGLEQVTFPRLAEKLDIKPPSLYNHFKNLTDLKIYTAIYLNRTLATALKSALLGQTGQTALLTYANVYRDFAIQYSGVYALLNTMPVFNNPELSEANHQNTAILNRLLQTLTPLSTTALLVASRGMRSLLHGYINLNQLGYFRKNDLSADESFNDVILTFLRAIQE